jgi:mannose-6-phosphate isomerase
MPQPYASLDAAAADLGAWLREAALPLWSTAGLDPVRGSFQEALTVAGEPWPAPRRSRVQTRQVWVYASCAVAGLGEHYGELARRAHGFYRAHYRRPDGLFARAADADGAVTDPTPLLYEQAFSLLALSALHRLAPQAGHAAEAHALLQALQSLRHPAGGFREAGEQPFQANAHMHLLEAALAWEAAAPAAAWTELADEVVALALERFVDPERGVLREFFDAAWRPLDEAAGQLIEPGHQFEWAWLLDDWARRRRRADVGGLARRLYASGLAGVDGEGVAVAAIWSDLSVRDAAARVWAQTEFLKAALTFGEGTQALRAASALRFYLDTPRRGSWRDRLTAERRPIEEPAPATAFYHLVGAILPLVTRG